MRINSLTYLFIALCSSILAACNRADAPDFLKAAGPEQTLTRTLDALPKHLWVNDDVDIVLVQGLDHLELTGPKNILPDITTNLANGLLEVKNENTYNWVRTYHPITLSVPLDSLVEIRQLGFGKIISIDTLKTQNLALKVYGAAHVQILAKVNEISIDLNGLGTAELAGNAQYAYIALRKYASLQAPQFTALRVDLEQDGAGDALLNIQNTVYISQKGPGCALLYGRPAIDSTTRKGTCIRFL